jgi:FolB domain-containing protein
MDIIFLRELKVVTLIGIYEWEKRVPQTLQLDLDIALPNSRACQSDDIKDALDYAQVAQHIQSVLASSVDRFNNPAIAQQLRGATHVQHVPFMRNKRICPTPSFYG